MDAGTALRGLLGGLLLAAGVLIAASCGLCTGYFALSAFDDVLHRQDGSTLWVAAPFLLAGIVGTAVGIGIAWGGLALLRRSPGPGEDGPTDRGE